MKKQLFTLAFILSASLIAMAQKTLIPTSSFKITGNIKAEMSYTIAQLDSFPKTCFQDQIIYNHKGEIKDTLSTIKGVPLKEILQPIIYTYEKPKELNEFYFVLTASDNYKIILSWNELYNTELGNSFFIITEMKGKKITEMEQRIAFISIADIKTGRRYLKNLQSIEVKRLE